MIQSVYILSSILILTFLSLIKCDLELCERTIDYLVDSEFEILLSNNNSTYRWNELNSLLASNLNRCSIIRHDDELVYEDKSIPFGVEFCEFSYVEWNGSDKRKLIDQSNRTAIVYSDQQNDQSKSVNFCLPNTCSKDDLYLIDERHFEQLFNQINSLIMFRDQSINYSQFHQLVQIDRKSNGTDLKCTQSVHSGIKWDFYAFNTFFLSLSCLIIVSTLIDYLSKSTSRVESGILLNSVEESNYQSIHQNNSKCDRLKCKKFFIKFSILNSLNRLTFVDHNITINCIYGLKVWSIIWIIIGHSYIYLASISKNYIEFKHQITHQFIFRLVLNCTFAVDTFFTLSGFLLSYLLFKRKLIGSDFWKPIILFRFYFHRYWRLTPVYAFILWFYVSLLNNLGDGSIWLLFEAENCEKNWWQNLIYINNLDKFSEKCMSHTWYLSNDMQFFIISPILLFFLSRNLKLGCLIIGSISIASSIITFMISYTNRLTETNGFLDLNNDINYLNLIYQKPYCRIGAYVIGLLTGYLLNENKIINRLNKTVYLYIGDLFSCLILFSIVLIYSNDWSYIQFAFYFSLSRQIWSLCICWLILTCYLRPQKLINRILSFKIFILLSRLTYVVYLIHPIMITFYYATRTQQIIVDQYTVLIHTFVTTICSFIFAFLINLIVEIPFSNFNFSK